MLVTARGRATFSGGARPAGSPDPVGVLATAIEAFQRLYLGGIQERKRIGVGGPGQIVEDLKWTRARVMATSSR
jgi:hypothetical protein